MIGWLHIGDLHIESADGWNSARRLSDIVRIANAHLTDLDFLYLPGDNANNAAPAEYSAMLEALGPLLLPWRTVPGDHDFEERTLAAYRAAVPERSRPEVEVVAGHRCVFLDIVSAGSGGPDFRLTMHDRVRLGHELAIAQACGQVPLVFMHAYPGDLAADGPEVARMLADGGVRFVDTGHTHYNELLNDGRVVYGATRSTGQIEEADGVAGYAVVCVHDGVPSWRFRTLDAPWPALQIVSPADVRLVTRVGEAVEVPRPGPVEVAVRAFGRVEREIRLTLDGRDAGALEPGSRGIWRGRIAVAEAGLHRIAARSGEASDAIEVLVRPADAPPKRRPAVSLGESCHAIGAWRQAGILGTRLGPNSNGRDW